MTSILSDRNTFFPLPHQEVSKSLSPKTQQINTQNYMHQNKQHQLHLSRGNPALPTLCLHRAAETNCSWWMSTSRAINVLTFNYQLPLGMWSAHDELTPRVHLHNSEASFLSPPFLSIYLYFFRRALVRYLLPISLFLHTPQETKCRGKGPTLLPCSTTVISCYQSTVHMSM